MPMPKVVQTPGVAAAARRRPSHWVIRDGFHGSAPSAESDSTNASDARTVPH